MIFQPGGGGHLEYFADRICTPFWVLFSPLFLTYDAKRTPFSRAGFQKGYFVGVSCYFIFFPSIFYVLEYTFRQFFSEAGYHLEGKFLKPDEKFTSWSAHCCSNEVK